MQASKLGKRVLVVDRRDKVGGVSIHTGTIPSKTLRQAILDEGVTRAADLPNPLRPDLDLADAMRSLQATDGAGGDHRDRGRPRSAAPQRRRAARSYGLVRRRPHAARRRPRRRRESHDSDRAACRDRGRHGLPPRPRSARCRRLTSPTPPRSSAVRVPALERHSFRSGASTARRREQVNDARDSTSRRRQRQVAQRRGVKPTRRASVQATRISTAMQGGGNKKRGAWIGASVLLDARRAAA